MKKISLTLIMMLVGMFAVPSASWAANNTASGSTPAYAAEEGVEGEEGEEGEEEEEEEPYVEPPFTVSFKLNDPNAVYFTVDDGMSVNIEIDHMTPGTVTDERSGRSVTTTIADDGVITIVTDPGDANIRVHVVDGYAFRKFTDTTKSSDYLQYSYQTMPVTVRKYIKTGISEDDEPIVVDGDMFTVTTIDLSTLTQYSLTVNVDHADKAELRIGVTSDFNSSANRTVELVDGENIITYSSIEKYLHITGSSMYEPLQSAMCAGQSLSSDGSGFNPVYTLPLSKSTNGAVIDVVTYVAPEADKFSFTATFDDIEGVKGVYRVRGTDSKICSWEEGENTYTFNAGDYFELWVYTQPLSCTLNDEALTIDEDLMVYTFYPTRDSELNVQFLEKPQVFNVYVDDATIITDFYDNANSSVKYTLTNGKNEIPYPGANHTFIIKTVDRQKANVITLDGNTVGMYRSQYYTLKPSENSALKVFFTAPAMVYFDNSTKGFANPTVHYMCEGDTRMHDMVMDAPSAAAAPMARAAANTYSAQIPANAKYVLFSDGGKKKSFTNTYEVTDGTTYNGSQTTGVQNVATDNVDDAAAPVFFYDLRGRRLNAASAADLTPGLYITSTGRKIIVK